MAVFSVQLVLSMIMASLLSKMAGHVSFARWLLCNGRLARYLHPSDDELRTMAGIPAGGGGKGRGKKDGRYKSDSLTIPRSTPIALEAAPIRKLEVLPLHYYTEYQWLVDFSLCALFVYGITELYYLFLRPDEFNLSVMWCLLVTGFCVKILFSLTAMYFRSEEGGERSMCIVFGFFFLVVAMAVIIMDDGMLEFGLESAYRNFSREAENFLAQQGIGSTGPASLLTIRIVMIIMAAILGSFLTFPGLRLAKMHSDALKYAGESPFLQLLLHANLAAPLILTIMWVRPVVRDFVVVGGRGTHRWLLEPEQFESLRVMMVFGFCAFRFLLIWPHLQAHLNMAVERVEAIRLEAGRISATDLQKLIVRVFYYLCVVALQYLTPLILLLYSAFMLKTLGGFSMAESFNIDVPVLIHRSAANVTTTPAEDGSILASAAQFSFALSSLRKVFTPLCFRALYSFLCWWICMAWFTTSAFGMVFHTYFSNWNPSFNMGPLHLRFFTHDSNAMEINFAVIPFQLHCYKILHMPWQHSCLVMCKIL